MDSKEHAKQLTKKAKELHLQIERSSLALGKIYAKITTGNPALYRQAGYKNFDLWLEAVGGHKSSQAYKLIETYRDLKDADVPESVIDKMPLNNARDYLKIPESKRTVEVMQNACEQTNRDFRETIEKVQPGLKLPENDYISFQVDVEALKFVIRPALDEIQKREEGCETQGDCLEYLCKEYLERIGGGSEAEQRLKDFQASTVQ